MTLPQILLVEDDRSIAGALAYTLKNVYDIDCASSAKLALYKAETEHFDCIVLDISLPDFSGMIVCQELRDRGLRTPILILSGDDSTSTKIKLLDIGANDYLSKPFSLGEIKARIRVLLREAHHVQVVANNTPLSQHGISLDRRTYQVIRDDTLIELRRKEFDILEYLLEHSGQVISRESLTNQFWSDDIDHVTNTVTVHIKSLRDKIDRPFGSPLIHTVHGRGYKFDASPAYKTKAMV